MVSRREQLEQTSVSVLVVELDWLHHHCLHYSELELVMRMVVARKLALVQL